MDTSGFDPEQAERLNAWGRALKKVGGWGLAAVVIVGSIAAWWKVTSEDNITSQFPPGEDSDDDDEGGGGLRPSVKTPRMKTPRAVQSVALEAAETPGASDQPEEDEEDEDPLGPWVRAMMALPEGSFGPDSNNPEAVQELQMMIFFNELQALMHVLTGKPKQQLSEMMTELNSPEVQGTARGQELAQMIQMFSAQQQQELSQEEQAQRHQIYLMLQMQQHQQKLQQTIMAAQEEALFQALPPECSSKVQEFKALIAAGEQAVQQALALGDEQAIEKTVQEISAQRAEKLHECDESLSEERRAQLHREKSDIYYNEAMKFARFQIEVEISAGLQYKLNEFVQMDQTSNNGGPGQFCQWWMHQQMEIANEQDMEKRQTAALKLPERMKKRLKKSELYAKDYHDYVQELTEGRQRSWRDQILESQLAHERNEIRSRLLSAEDRATVNDRQMKMQISRMQGTQEELSPKDQIVQMEEGLDKAKLQELELLMKSKQLEIEKQYLPKSEIASEETREMQSALERVQALSSNKSMSKEEVMAEMEKALNQIKNA